MPENLETLKLILLPILREHGLKLAREVRLKKAFAVLKTAKASRSQV